MPLTVSQDLTTEPCVAEESNADPDLDLVADVHNLKCIGLLRYMVFGLQEAIKKYNEALDPKGRK